MTRIFPWNPVIRVIRDADLKDRVDGPRCGFHLSDYRKIDTPVVDEKQLMAVLSMRDIPTKYRFMREKWLEMRQGGAATPSI